MSRMARSRLPLAVAWLVAGLVCAQSASAAWEVKSHLYALDLKTRFIFPDIKATSGGALAPIGDELLIVSGAGRLGFLPKTGPVVHLPDRVPMNVAAWQAYEFPVDPKGEPWGPRYWPFRAADILVKPRADGRHDLFVSHHYFTGECVLFRVSAVTLKHDAEGLSTTSPWRTVFDAAPCFPFPHYGHQAGGPMLLDGDDHLLVFVGDHGRDGWGTAEEGRLPILPQAPDSHLGKLVRVEIATGRAEIFTSGHRNPLGLARDRAGRLWATEHGAHGGDELNLLAPGRDYGWPAVTYGITYDKTAPPGIENEDVGGHDGYSRPVYSWIPSIAPTGMTVNDPRRFPLWRDDLLLASLRAQSVFRIRRHGSALQYVEQIHIGIRLRDLAWMADGRLAMLQDRENVIFVEPSTAHCDEESRRTRAIFSLACDEAGLSATPDGPAAAAPATPAAQRPASEQARNTDGARLFAQHCSQCHHAHSPRHGIGPHLKGLIGRRAGEVKGFAFSPAFRSLEQTWDRESLARFIADTSGFVPGTTMADAGTEVTQSVAEQIASYLDDG